MEAPISIPILAVIVCLIPKGSNSAKMFNKIIWTAYSFTPIYPAINVMISKVEKSKKIIMIFGNPMPR